MSKPFLFISNMHKSFILTHIKLFFIGVISMHNNENREIPNKSINYCYTNYSGLSMKTNSYFCFGGALFFFIIPMWISLSNKTLGIETNISPFLGLPISIILIIIGIFCSLIKTDKSNINRLKSMNYAVQAKVVNYEPPEYKKFARTSLTPMYILVCVHQNQYGQVFEYRVPIKESNPQSYIGKDVVVYLNPNNYSDYMVDLDVLK